MGVCALFFVAEYMVDFKWKYSAFIDQDVRMAG